MGLLATKKTSSLHTPQKPCNKNQSTISRDNQFASNVHSWPKKILKELVLFIHRGLYLFPLNTKESEFSNLVEK